MNYNIGNKDRIITNFWNHVHFHPTDAIEDNWGKIILDNISSDGVAQYVRIYAMLEDIVSLDKYGELTYDFEATDKRIDYMIEKGFELLICFNFMPLAIADDTTKISVFKRHKGKRINTSKPKDYKLWQEVCKQYTKHLLDRYGEERLLNWYLHCWNEPDLDIFWLSGVEDFAERTKEHHMLYDHFAAGVLEANDKLKIGGPSAAGINEFIESFLEHTSSGTNYVTGEIGTRLDFFSAHTYGMGPKDLTNGENLSVSRTLNKTIELNEIAKKYGYGNIEMIVDEWEATYEGFLSMKDCPELVYRNNEYFSAFFAKTVDLYIKGLYENKIPLSKMMICLSGQHGLVRDFEGYRNFFTLNHFAKPIYNSYALCAKLGDVLLKYDGDDCSDMGIVPTKNVNGDYKILIYYNNDDANKRQENRKVSINIDNIKGNFILKHYRIDHDISNSFTSWCAMGKPENPNQFEREMIMQDGKLKLLYPQESIKIDGKYSESVLMSQNSVSLIELTRYE